MSGDTARSKAATRPVGRDTTAKWEGTALGPYQLVDPIGTGGMATVWEALHGATWSPVAIKLLKTKQAAASSFRNELRLSASLDHPSIVRIHDFGSTVEPVVHRGDEILPAGGLYLAMELVRGGSLEPLCARLVWRDIHTILLRLLDGLAHAHARGIVHRDIKPANVLVNADRTEVKLTDFGIARAVDGALTGELEKAFSGTPAYMAPEQCRREARDYGPWTDFYALGCLGYALITGLPPFPEARTVVEVLEAHTNRAPPPLQPATAVPRGIDNWLRTLLAKDPGDRFQRASEAARALQVLPRTFEEEPDLERWIGVTDPDEVDTQPDQPTPETMSLVAMGARFSTLNFDAVAAKAAPETLAPRAGAPTLDGAPPAVRWEYPKEVRSPSRPQLGGNLALYWLRRPPMAGRLDERNALWEALQEATTGGVARAVILRGGAGTGKSRLARWVGERAHEIASASLLEVPHDADEPIGSALTVAVARRLKLGGLRRSQAVDRLTRLMESWGVWEPSEMTAIARLLLPDGSGRDHDDALSRRREERLLQQRLVRYLAGGRPMVLWLDDVQFGLASLEVVRRLLSGRVRNPIPLLIVLTVQSADLADRPAEAAMVDELSRRASVRDLEIGPLDEQEHRALVESLLPLEPELVETVTQRTEGNPQFAVQLLGNWIERDLLEPGPRGLRLDAGAEVDLPDDLHEVWSGRIEQFLKGRGIDDAAALEMAAMQGRRIDPGDWNAACSQAGLSPSAGLVDSLLDAHLATCGPGGPEEGWSLAHALLRESLERRAAESGRNVAHHLAIARSLRSRAGLSAAERVASHLLAANRPNDAVGPLLDAIQTRLEAGDLARAGVLLEQFDHIGRSAALNRNLFGRGRLLHARLAGLRGDDERFDFWADEVEEITTGLGIDGRKLRIALTFEKARRCFRRAELDLAWQRLEVVEQYAEEVRDDAMMARCLDEKAGVAHTRGDLDVAQTLLQRCVIAHEAAGNPAGAGRALAKLAEMAARSGAFGTANDLTTLASGYFTRADDRAGTTSLLVVRALAARLEGDLSRAAELYREALGGWEAIGAPQARTTQLALAQVLVLDQKFEDAEPLLEGCLSWFAARDEPGGVAVSRLTLLPLLAHQGRWDEWDTHFAMGKDQLDATGYIDQDAAECATQAGNVASAFGHPARAWKVWQLAKRLVERTGRRYEA